MKILAIALLALAPGAAASPAPSNGGSVVRGPAFEDLIAICRTAFVEQLQGKKPEQALAMVNAMPVDQRPAAVLVCAAYEQGQRDLIELIQSSPPGAVKPISI